MNYYFFWQNSSKWEANKPILAKPLQEVTKIKDSTEAKHEITQRVYFLTDEVRQSKEHPSWR